MCENRRRDVLMFNAIESLCKSQGVKISDKEKVHAILKDTVLAKRNTECYDKMMNELIFVFGSNLAGRHGKGAALFAKLNYDAVCGIGEGATGRSYALPTKDGALKTLPLDVIKSHVDVFIEYAKNTPFFIFKITQIGCGLAGYKPEQIAPMFNDAPDNCFFDDTWQPFMVLDSKQFW